VADEKKAAAMEVIRSRSEPSSKGVPFFTGHVSSELMFKVGPPGRTRGSTVTFEPGARTAWHSHPLGQILIITAGAGLVQCWGGPIEEVQPGHVVVFAAGEKHWHGARPDSGVTHISILELLDGKQVDWMEQVTDEQYLGSTPTAQR
jgi:quercetin dioxygenase-like cupin family protein